jgi:NAD(P)-dependent dehydrogenase (short-subunit alcohol dehydrogenase family)
MQINLENKVIFINGLTGAIGEALAGRCSSLGAEVYGIYGKDRLKAEALLREKGIKSLSIDFSREKAAPDKLKKFLRHKKIHALINAHGLTIDRPLIRLNEKDWDRVLDVNLTSIFHLSRSILPNVAEGGRIINLASSAGLIGSEGQANYASAKAGLWAFTKSLAREAAGNNIMVNLILPGFIPSKMTKSAPRHSWEKAKRESLTGKLMKTEVVTDFIIYLLSKYAQGITGQAFNIDSRIRRWW